jgi:hypothetical protein
MIISFVASLVGSLVVVLKNNNNKYV